MTRQVPLLLSVLIALSSRLTDSPEGQDSRVKSFSTLFEFEAEIADGAPKECTNQ